MTFWLYPLAALASVNDWSTRSNRELRAVRHRTEAIPMSACGLDDTRSARVGFKLAPQPLDEGAQVIAVTDVFRSPDLAEQRAVVERSARVLRQEREERPLGGGQPHLHPTARNGASPKVDDDIAAPHHPR